MITSAPPPSSSPVAWPDGASGDVGGEGEATTGGESEAGGAPVDAATSTMMGIDITVTPSAVEAAAAVPRVEDSVVCTAAGVVEAGTAMVAVMSTLPAVTVTVTAEVSTPAAAAIEVRREAFLVSSKSLTLPLTVMVSTTAVDDGSDGGGGGGEGDGGGGEGDGGGGEGDGGGGEGDSGSSMAIPGGSKGGGGGGGGGGIAGGGGDGGGEETTHEPSSFVPRLSKLLASGAMQPVIA